jgi:hypothetical protein
MKKTVYSTKTTTTMASEMLILKELSRCTFRLEQLTLPMSLLDLFVWILFEGSSKMTPLATVSSDFS